MKKSNDNEKMATAVEILEISKIGEQLALDSAIAATDQMIRLMPQLKTASAKEASLRYHALYLGIGTRFMETVAPRAEEMAREVAATTGMSMSGSKVIAGIWLAKVFKEMHKRMDKLSEDDE